MTLVEGRPRISVFFPMYNEEDNIRSTALAAIAVLEDLASEFEIILVDLIIILQVYYNMLHQKLLMIVLL